jgi:hypothetical protein
MHALALRLPSEKLQHFLEKFKTELCVQHGAVMKEYAIVPDALLMDTNELASYFTHGYDYVNSLKPKPSAKTAKTKKS